MFSNALKMAIIKKYPEDFVVKELYADIKVLKDERAPFALFVLMKKNLTTLEAIQKVAKYFKISIRDVGYAGNKDKNAISFQLISVPSNYVSVADKKTIDLNDLTLKFFGYSKEPIKLGMLKGNVFEITIRDIKNFSEFQKLRLKLKSLWIPNYFDDQRFSKYNVDIGRAIVKGDFALAVKYILKYSYDDVDELFGYWRDFKLEKADSLSRIVLEHLLKQPRDFVGAIKRLPTHVSLIYVHAYQSFLFNNVLSDFINLYFDEKKKIQISRWSYFAAVSYIEFLEKVKIPLVGFATDISKYAYYDVGALVLKQMTEEGLTFRDFVIHSYPLLTTTGSERSAFNNVKINIQGIKTPKMSFELPPGSYATIVVKTIFSLIDEPVNVYEE